MRILIAVAGVLFLGTAGCGQQSGNGQTQANGLPNSGPRQENQTYYSEVNRNAWRGANIGGCILGAQNRAGRRESPNPAGADFRPYCTCFIDRVMAGLRTDQLEGLQFGAPEQAVAAQCAQENGLRPDARVIENLGGPFPDLMPASGRP